MKIITEGYNGGILIYVKNNKTMKKLKIICDWDKDYDTLITQEKLKNGDLDRNSWWYLDGRLEEKCGYDKGTVYNLSEHPNLRKETLDWSSISGEHAEVWGYTKHYEMHADGEFEVEVYGIKEECIGIFWTTCERLVGTQKGIKFKIWNQRGLVCMKTDIEAIERARRKRAQRTENL